jgi:RNA polymerase sigma factor (sigma-70 family)
MRQIGYDTTKEYENNINELRVEHSLTLKQLANLIQISHNYLWKITQGYHGPINQNGKKFGQIKPWAKKLELIFNCELFQIFPREICDINWNKILVKTQIASIVHSYETEEERKGRLLDQQRSTWIDLGMEEVLSERERTIIKLRYLNSKSYQDIGNIYEVSRERIRQICCRSLNLLINYCFKMEKQSNK